VTTLQAAVPVSFKKWIVVSAVVGYSALIIYLLYFVGFFSLISALEKVNIGIYLLAITTVIVSITLHTMVWFKLLNQLNIKLSFRRTNVLYWVGIFVDNLIPGGWSGDLFKAYLLGREPDIDSGKAVASVVVKNMYEAIFNLGNMVLGLVLLLLNYTFEGTILFGIGGVMLLLTLPLFFLMVISFKPKGAKKTVDLFVRGVARVSKNLFNLSKFQVEIDKLLDDYHEGMKILIKNPKMLGQPMLLSFLAWGFEILTLYLVFVSLGFIVPADKVIIVRSIAGNIEAQGYAFAGYAQIITTALYTALGIFPAVAASVGILGGVVVFWLKTSIAYIAFHCVIFADCAGYVCRVVRASDSDRCKKESTEYPAG
jgi:uncharacterized protein (TIRG00374 family)